MWGKWREGASFSWEQKMQLSSCLVWWKLWWFAEEDAFTLVFWFFFFFLEKKAYFSRIHNKVFQHSSFFSILGFLQSMYSEKKHFHRKTSSQNLYLANLTGLYGHPCMMRCMLYYITMRTQTSKVLNGIMLMWLWNKC